MLHAHTSAHGPFCEWNRFDEYRLLGSNQRHRRPFLQDDPRTQTAREYGPEAQRLECHLQVQQSFWRWKTNLSLERTWFLICTTGLKVPWSCTGRNISAQRRSVWYRRDHREKVWTIFTEIQSSSVRSTELPTRQCDAVLIRDNDGMERVELKEQKQCFDRQFTTLNTASFFFVFLNLNLNPNPLISTSNRPSLCRTVLATGVPYEILSPHS